MNKNVRVRPFGSSTPKASRSSSTYSQILIKICHEQPFQLFSPGGQYEKSIFILTPAERWRIWLRNSLVVVVYNHHQRRVLPSQRLDRSRWRSVSWIQAFDRRRFRRKSVRVRRRQRGVRWCRRRRKRYNSSPLWRWKFTGINAQEERPSSVVTLWTACTTRIVAESRRL